MYYKQHKTAFIFMDKTLFYLKKTFNLIRSLLKANGSLLILGSNNYYFKDIKKSNFFLRENINQYDIYKGLFSNHLYIKNNMIMPNLFLIFNSNRYHLFIKELKSIGILTIGVINKDSLITCEYPIVLNDFSYFSNFFLLNIYSKIILLNKV